MTDIVFSGTEKADLLRLLDGQYERLQEELERSRRIECHGCLEMQRHYADLAIRDVVALRRKVQAL